MVSQADYLNCHALRAREEHADGTIGVPRFLAIVSIQDDDVIEKSSADDSDKPLRLEGKVTRSWCATQAAVGVVVTAQRTTSRRPWRMTRKT